MHEPAPPQISENILPPEIEQDIFPKKPTDEPDDHPPRLPAMVPAVPDADTSFTMPGMYYAFGRPDRVPQLMQLMAQMEAELREQQA